MQQIAAFSRLAETSFDKQGTKGATVDLNTV